MKKPKLNYAFFVAQGKRGPAKRNKGKTKAELSEITKRGWVTRRANAK